MRTSTFISKSLKCAVISFFFIVAGTFNSNAQQYCSVSGDCTEGDQIHNFSTTGAIVNITNNNSGCSPAGYGNFTANHSLTVSPGMTVNISVQTLPTSSYDQGFAIWIDWNQNTNFSDPGELVWNSSTYGTQVFTGSFTVQLTATPGTTRMRVMCSYYCVPSNPCSPCDTYNETEDYTVIVAGGTDAGLESFYSLPDTICSGPQPVEVVLKNHGPFNMTSVDIEWAVDNVTQPTFNWSGALAANETDTVMIGTYPFVQGMNYQIMAYTSGPNNSTDTVNHNDTIVKPEVVTKPSPELVLNDTLLNICQGDTAYINGTLTGTAPWSLMINDGTTNVPVTNITANAFSIPVTPASSKTYTITSLMDATGCENKSIYSVEIVVQPAPPAIITPLGSTAACEGDSVSLMASIGLNFGYQWYKDGVALPNDTN